MATPHSRTLRPEDEIAHYRIVGPLGAGGMGEVYLAQDRTLGRNVALKVLPPELVRNEERVRRFVLEARSASSLSHPNIVTIHEIGHDQVHAAGEQSSDPVHYISMELVSGKTLGTLIHEDRADLRALLGWLAQAADGIAKAHAAGIVHRDLKPGNIMVTSDGFAKVLDFGLAKLTEQAEVAQDATSDPTVGQGDTGAGAVVGTAGYMSPEQVRGKHVDHRSDVFSFGCILYEAATRRRAFAAESSVETMHQVLNDTPAPIEDLNPKAPAELRRLIRRCLQKNPEQRLQSMKDVALELREIEAEYDSLSASASSGSHAALPALAARRGSPVPWIAGGVLLLAALAAGWWFAARGRAPEPAYLKMRMTTQTTSGDVADAVLSPDGRYLAYLSAHGGRVALRVRQVATGSDVDIVSGADGQAARPSFSPDGNYLFYSAPRADNPRYSALYQVPSLGGTPREIAFDVDSRASASPDGRSIVFHRHVIDTTQDRVVVMDLASRRERILARIEPPLSLGAGPVWSPDGRRIAVALQDARADAPCTIAFYDAATGRRQDWATLDRTFVNSIAWLPGGAGLVTAGMNLNTSFYNQVALVTGRRDGASPVTNDFGNYSAVSTAATEPLIAAVRTTSTGNVLLVDADAGDGEPRRLTTANSPENSFMMLAPGDSASAVGTIARDGVLQVCRLPVDGGAPILLTHDAVHSIRPNEAGGVVVFDRFDASGLHTWACAPDGSALRQLTRGAGEQCVGLSHDGRRLAVAHVDDPTHVSIVSTTDGRVLREVTEFAGGGLFSPDGKSLGVLRATRDAGGLTEFAAEALPVEGGAPTASVPLPATTVAGEWAPDGSALTVQDRADPNWNVFRQPLDGGPRTRITRVTAGRVLQFRWSPDGRRLALLVRTGDQVDLWTCAPDGSGLKRVASIAPETPTGIGWLDDSRRIVVGVATQSSDAVLIRDFR